MRFANRAILGLTSTLILASCGEKAEEEVQTTPKLTVEERAVAALEQEIKTKKLIEAADAVEAAKKTGANPFELLKAYNRKLSSLSTEDLPEDLKEAIESAQSLTGVVVAHLNDSPVPLDFESKAEQDAWFRKQVSDEEGESRLRKEMERWQKYFDAISAEADKKGDQVNTVLEKYGINLGMDEDEEEKAVAAFKKELKEKKIIEGIREIKTMPGIDKEDPMAFFRLLNGLHQNVQSVNRDGLPADLEQAVSSFQSELEKMVNHFDECPIPMEVIAKGETAVRGWFVDQHAADSDFQTKFEQSRDEWIADMKTLIAEIEKRGESRKKIFKKYDIPLNLSI